MDPQTDNSHDSDRPVASPDRRRKWLKFACLAALITALVVPAIQFQYRTAKTLAKGDTRGALARWRTAVGEFWAGKNIYLTPAQAQAAAAGCDGGQAKATAASNPSASQPAQATADDEGPSEGGTNFLHPNMPFVVILMSPLSLLPVMAMGIVVNLLKLLIVVGSLLAMIEVAGHKKLRPVYWVAGLGMLWAYLPILGDIQHGNTNVFILGALALHLWLYRRGQNVLAGGSLALAICLKLTPALFLLYWIYQRNWKLLAGTVAALVLFVAIVPSAAVGSNHAWQLTETWLDNLIVPGLVKNSPYPIHINQSLPAMLDRLFQPYGSPEGNLFWNPDDVPDYSRLAPADHAWITVASLSPETVHGIFRLCQLLLLALLGWTIGWRKLPRDDGRRGLHYALIVLAMMILNQRTWDHHLAVLLVATVPLWFALVQGKIHDSLRKIALLLTLTGGLVLILTRQDFLRKLGAMLFGYGKENAKMFADVVEAYGPSFFFLMTLFAAAVALALALKRNDEPYMELTNTK